MSNSIVVPANGRNPPGISYGNPLRSSMPNPPSGRRSIVTNGVFAPPPSGGGNRPSSNETISFKYVQTKKAARQQEQQGYHFEHGDAVFILRKVEQTSRLYLTVPIYALNYYLRQMADAAINANSKDYRALLEHLQQYDETLIQQYAMALNRRKVQATYSGDEDLLTTSKRAYELAIRPDLYALTKTGILYWWNFAGLLQNTNESARSGSDQSMGYSRVQAVNVVCQKRIENTTNYWGTDKDVPSNTPLYFVLTKEQKQPVNGTPSRFVIIPFGNLGYTHPPMSMMGYMGLDGSQQCGHAWHVGHMHLPSKALSKESFRRQAAGVDASSLPTAMESSAVLPRCKVQVRVN